MVRLRVLFTEVLPGPRSSAARNTPPPTAASGSRARFPMSSSRDVHALLDDPDLRGEPGLAGGAEDRALGRGCGPESMVLAAARSPGWMGAAVPTTPAYWVEETHGRTPSVSLNCSPIEVGPRRSRDELFGKIPSVILASLPRSRSAARIFRSSGPRGARRRPRRSSSGVRSITREAGDLDPRDRMPDPTEQAGLLKRRASSGSSGTSCTTDGRAFVLFTSYKMLKACADRLTGGARSTTICCRRKGAGAEPFVDAGPVPAGWPGGVVRDRYVLAGGGCSWGCAAERDYHQAAAQCAGSSVA